MEKLPIDRDDEQKPGKEEEAKNKISSSDCCIIYCSDSTETLRKFQSHVSWITLLNVAEIQNYKAILDVKPQFAKSKVSNILYHRRCRSIFTLKDSLNRIKVGFWFSICKFMFSLCTSGKFLGKKSAQSKYKKYNSG